MYQNLHKQLVTSNRQTRLTSKHKNMGKVRVFSLIKMRRKYPTNRLANHLLNPLRKLEDFLNNPRGLKELVTIHGRKK